MNEVETEFEAYDFSRHFKKDPPYACLQWKGTDVCLDFECECGAHGHYDGYFSYNVKCPKCGNVYYMVPYITLIRIRGKLNFTGCVVEPEEPKLPFGFSAGTSKVIYKGHKNT